MRLWTVHPKYLDAAGLVAVWREGLLARKVLHGLTKGYTRHPQLTRFREHPDPLKAIDAYLAAILEESVERGYHFDSTKIDARAQATPICETRGQLAYEWQHLLRKLRKRSPELFEVFRHETAPAAHPLFSMEEGDVRDWEKR